MHIGSGTWLQRVAAVPPQGEAATRQPPEEFAVHVSKHADEYIEVSSPSRQGLVHCVRAQASVLCRLVQTGSRSLTLDHVALVLPSCIALIFLISCLPVTAEAVNLGNPDPIAAQNSGLLSEQQLPESEQAPLSSALRLPTSPLPAVQATPAGIPAPPKRLQLSGLVEAPPKADDIPEFPSLDDLEVEARLERLSKLPPSRGLDIVRTGLTQKGRRYRWGGTAPASGFDCSGFTQWTFQQHGISLPRTAQEQYHTGVSVSRQELRAGDLVFYKINRRGRWHVGIYMEDGTFVHSPRRGRNISEANMSDSYWAKRYKGARRYVR